MGTPRTSLRLVIFQIRTHLASKLQEQGCFIERSNLARRQIEFINVVDTPNVGWKHVENAHAVIIGGAGAFSVSDTTHPFTDPLIEIIH